MRIILSLPHLRHLRVDGLYICPELLDGDDLDDSVIAPLVTFHYVMPHYRQPWSFPSEAATIDFLVQRINASLSSLMLPVESAPIRTISSLHWPWLREFTLRGERWADPATPIVALFSSIPSLQSLALELSELENATPGVIWPKGMSTTFQWRDLRSLRVSHPNPVDEAYSRLPSSLCSLALRLWPHQCERVYQLMGQYLGSSGFEGYKRRRWSHPLSTPHTLAEVLRKCDLPRLRGLELEYREDAQESELLQLVVIKFPFLTTLEIHRFRREGRKDVPVRELANALAPLTELRTFKLHLDFPHMPTPGYLGIRGIARHVPVPDYHRRFDDTLASTADDLSRTLAPSLEEIWLYALSNEPAWIVFVVSRTMCEGELQIGAVRKDQHWYRYCE
ncbi:hypothetical protein GSI_09764 [Ganoderma sinense ZZ0214-1]|uniref:F-box domain-containing protein n=1 Tax=Ganoderma sinense ZZ0214-1 TaxID=1077348 RepID=A0A2G8S2V2_9APHY|nr:hypothetical protein GSI_09764 [Ganoderma sinense ZZ0214-1]